MDPQFCQWLSTRLGCALPFEVSAGLLAAFAAGQTVRIMPHEQEIDWVVVSVEGQEEVCVDAVSGSVVGTP